MIVLNSEESDVKALMRGPLTFPEGMRCTCEGHLTYYVEGVWPSGQGFKDLDMGQEAVFVVQRER